MAKSQRRPLLMMPSPFEVLDKDAEDWNRCRVVGTRVLFLTEEEDGLGWQRGTVTSLRRSGMYVAPDVDSPCDDPTLICSVGHIKPMPVSHQLASRDRHAG